MWISKAKYESLRESREKVKEVVIALEDDLATARETNARLNRRCQRAEAKVAAYTRATRRAEKRRADFEDYAERYQKHLQFLAAHYHGLLRHFSRDLPEPVGAPDTPESRVDAALARIAELEAEVERLRGLPPAPEGDANLTFGALGDFDRFRVGGIEESFTKAAPYAVDGTTYNAVTTRDGRVRMAFLADDHPVTRIA